MLRAGWPMAACRPALAPSKLPATPTSRSPVIPSMVLSASSLSRLWRGSSRNRTCSVRSASPSSCIGQELSLNLRPGEQRELDAPAGVGGEIVLDLQPPLSREPVERLLEHLRVTPQSQPQAIVARNQHAAHRGSGNANGTESILGAGDSFALNWCFLSACASYTVLVRLVGFEPTAFGSATQRSIP